MATSRLGSRHRRELRNTPLDRLEPHQDLTALAHQQVRKPGNQRAGPGAYEEPNPVLNLDASPHPTRYRSTNEPLNCWKLSVQDKIGVGRY
jgi:hypothetical protein